MADAAPASVDHYFAELELSLDKCAKEVEHDLDAFLTSSRKVGEAILHIAATDTKFAAQLGPDQKVAQDDVAKGLSGIGKLNDVVAAMLAVVRLCGNRGAHVQAPGKKPDVTIESACICGLLVAVNWAYYHSSFARPMPLRVAEAFVKLSQSSASPVNTKAHEAVLAELNDKLAQKTAQLHQAKLQLAQMQVASASSASAGWPINWVTAGMIAVISAGLAAVVAVILLPRTGAVGKTLPAQVHRAAPANDGAPEQVTARVGEPLANSPVQDTFAVAPSPLLQADATATADTGSAANPDVVAPSAEPEAVAKVEPADEPKAAVPTCRRETNPVDATELRLVGGPRPRKRWGTPLLASPPVQAVSAFCIDVAPVSTAQFRSALSRGELAGLTKLETVSGSNLQRGVQKFPINFVTWLQASAYCRAKGGSLPTIAQWEVAASKVRNIGFADKTSEWAADAFPPKVFGYRAMGDEDCKPGPGCRHLYHGQFVADGRQGEPKLGWYVRADDQPGLPNISFRCTFKPEVKPPD